MAPKSKAKKRPASKAKKRTAAKAKTRSAAARKLAYIIEILFENEVTPNRFDDREAAARAKGPQGRHLDARGSGMACC